jgi:hypothetical protein
VTVGPAAQHVEDEVAGEVARNGRRRRDIGFGGNSAPDCASDGELLTAVERRGRGDDEHR